jgi:murein DD-endopeptidase MepM/ murein hydrolase activator NlpD
MSKVIPFYAIRLPRYKVYLVLALVLCFSCKETSNQVKEVVQENVQHLPTPKKSKLQVLDSLFTMQEAYRSLQFDFPVGKPTSKGYYNAQKFGENNHLGDDWNGGGGGNSDLGDPIYSISNGYVSAVQDLGGGWGNVIRIVHSYHNTYYESVYAHCDTMYVKENQFIKRGEKIGSIGTANGAYLAHLHLEIRDRIFMDIGAGYATDTKGYLDPTTFIKTH